MKVVTRFAPSPTGHLHLGGARTAIFNWLFTRHYNGRFYLRIEDTDTLRSRQEYTDSILASMTWLGLDWDGELVYQSRRFDLYSRYVDRMLENGMERSLVIQLTEVTENELEQLQNSAVSPN